MDPSQSYLVSFQTLNNKGAYPGLRSINWMKIVSCDCALEALNTTLHNGYSFDGNGEPGAKWDAWSDGPPLSRRQIPYYFDLLAFPLPLLFKCV